MHTRSFCRVGDFVIAADLITGIFRSLTDWLIVEWTLLARIRASISCDLVSSFVPWSDRPSWRRYVFFHWSSLLAASAAVEFAVGILR